MLNKPYLLVSMALITACIILIGCNKKGTEPPDDKPEYKLAIVNAMVRDQDGNPIEGAWIISKYYYYMTAQNPSLKSSHTNEDGVLSYSLFISELPEKDSIWLWAVIVNQEGSIYSDTVSAKLANSNDTISTQFEFAL